MKVVRFKKIILFVVICLLMSCVHKVEKLYENGVLVASSSVKRATGELDGPTIEYYPNGNMFYKENYHNNLYDGDFLIFNMDKDTVFHVVYENGRVMNVEKYRTKYGRDLMFGDFSNGDGILKMYCFSGLLTDVGEIKNGYKTGWWISYHKGRKIDSVYFDKGVSSRTKCMQNNLLPEGFTMSFFMEN